MRLLPQRRNPSEFARSFSARGALLFSEDGLSATAVALLPRRASGTRLRWKWAINEHQKIFSHPERLLAKKMRERAIVDRLALAASRGEWFESLRLRGLPKPMQLIDRIQHAPAPIGHYHRIYLPTDPEQRLREIAEAEKPHRGPRTDPLLRSLVRAGIRRLMDTVRKTMNRPTEADLHDLHERRRERNRAKVREAIRALRPRIGPEARRRLADRHVAIIICADEDEVQQWYKRLEPQGKTQEIAAFVKWHNLDLDATNGGNQARINVPLVVWNGGSSIDEQSVYYHELAHLIDGHQSTRRISDDIEWQRLFERENGALRLMLVGEKTRDHLVSSSSESFAAAVAESWRNPANAAHRIPGMYRFLIQRGLVAKPALPSSANALL